MSLWDAQTGHKKVAPPTRSPRTLNPSRIPSRLAEVLMSGLLLLGPSSKCPVNEQRVRLWQFLGVLQYLLAYFDWQSVEWVRASNPLTRKVAPRVGVLVCRLIGVQNNHVISQTATEI